MFRHGEFSTEIDRKPFLFTLIAFLGSLIAALLILCLGKGDGLGVFAGILLLIVAVASGAVLFAMVTDQSYIIGEELHMRYLFRHAVIHIKKIGKVSFKDNVYSVYDQKGNLVGTINGQLTGIDSVLHVLYKSSVPFV